ncbi:MAG: hypothetical protein K0S34_2084 [Bacillales bacterium]|jgi:hypothetical protein|nr:hypothetical protein [Bacillales bacterium]
MMEDKNFDKFIKNKINEEPQVTPQLNIENLLQESINKSKMKKSNTINQVFAYVAAIILVVSGAILVTNIDEKDVTKTPETKYVVKNNKPNIEILKKQFASEGYKVNSSEIKAIDPGNEGDVTAQFDIAFIPTLKDYVFNSDFIVKGKVIGVNYLIKDKVAYTKAKILVEKSYLGQKKVNEIVTITQTGAIISHYDQIILHEIDKKFNMTKEELEKTKNDYVIEGAFDGVLLRPDDSVVVFAGQPWIEDNVNHITGTTMKFNGQNISNTNEGAHFEYLIDKEIQDLKTEQELEEKLVKYKNEKKSYSREKAIDVALNELGKNGELSFTKESARVYFHSNWGGIDEKQPSIDVDFKNGTGDYASITLTENYEIIRKHLPSIR